MEKIALLPGGFKPPHAGHYNMAKWLANNTDADTVIVKVGAKERDGITREMSLKLWDLYRSTDSDPAANKLSIIPSKHNSPVKDVYDFIEQDAPENSTIYLGMGEKEIKTNDQRFANIGKFADPKGINFETKLVPPQAGGVSGTDMRGFIMDKDQYSFFDYIPEHLTPEQKEQAWQIVTTSKTSEWKPGNPVSFEMWTSDWNLKSFGKEYENNFKNREDAVAHYRSDKAEDWAFKSYAYVAKKIPGFGGDLEEDLYSPEDPSLDFMRSSEWKAGMPDGSKDDIPRHGDRIHNRQTAPVSWEESKKLHEEENYSNTSPSGLTSTSAVLINKEVISLEVMNTPEKQIEGMMGRDELKGGLIFPLSVVQRRDFHMENCKIPLDIIFLKRSKISKIFSECPPCKETPCPQYTSMADDVIELPGGYCSKHNINEGDEVTLNLTEKISKKEFKTPNPQITLNELSDREIRFFALHAGILKQLNTPNYKTKYQELSQQLKGERLEALEYFYSEYLSKLDDGCELNEAPINLKRRSEGVKTYGDLKNIIKSITKKQKIGKGKEIALDVILDFIPGAGAAKTTLGFIKAAFNKPDTAKTDTWIDKLDVDDELSTIVDDTVENGFLVLMAKTIESKPDDEVLSSTFDMNIELIEYLKGKYKGRTVSMDETKYGSQYLLAQYKDEIQSDHGHQQYRNLQTLMSQSKDEEVSNWLKIKGYIKEASTFSKEWWSNMIYENIITEGGAAGHMAHPFNLSSVNSGKSLKDIFVKAANSLQSNPGSVKIDGVNSSIRLVDLEGKKQFVMDRGSKKPLDIKGITKDDLGNRFKTKDGSIHGMVKVGGEVLDMFNEALPSLEADLKKLGAWDDPDILFNMEYVSGKTNVQDYESNFIAIHGLNKVESKEVQGKRGPLIKRASSEMSYDKAALQSMLDNLTPVAKKNGFEVYGSVPTEMKKKPNFAAALSKSYTIKSNEGDKTQPLNTWLGELNNIPEEDFIFMNVNGAQKKVGAVSKQVYVTLLNGDNIDELYESEEDKQKAIEGFVTYLATEKLGDEILKVLDSPMGSVEDHEGVVIRDKNITPEPFKITGKFILGGMFSDF